MEENTYIYSNQFQYLDGNLYCEKVNVNDIRKSELCETIFPSSPLFVYSKAAIIDNIKQYKTALSDIKYILNYSVKANNNITILNLMREYGCSLTLVSGMELRLALDLGFEPSRLMFNGNGKMKWEIELAIQAGVLLNIDSIFNLQQMIDVCEKVGRSVDVLLRINPCIDVNIHRYFATGKSGSKFGLDNDELESCLQILNNTNCINVVGLHSHLGSTIDNVQVVRQSVELLMTLLRRLQAKGFRSIKYINIGGGLGIPYKKHMNRTLPYQCDEDQACVEELEQNLKRKDQTWNQNNPVCQERQNVKECSLDGRELDYLLTVADEYKHNRISKYSFVNLMSRYPKFKDCVPVALQTGTDQEFPTALDLVNSIKDLLDPDITLIIEPGRSLVGNAAVLVNTVLGCKKSSEKRFIVVDGAMTEVIRPSLYRAYHHIDLTEPSQEVSDSKQVYDIVGPVCECGDFLGQDRLLTTPHKGCGLAVFDVGAYCYSQASNYNLRLKPAEVMVDGDTWRIIRQPDSYEDLIRNYTDKPKALN